MTVTADNPYAGNSVGMDGVAPDGVAIVPSDTDDVGPHMVRAIYVGGTGDVTLVTSKGTTLVYKAVPVGVTIAMITKQVKSTGTSATFLVGMY